MSDYKVGFYYNHGYGYASDVHWLITFNGECFKVQPIDGKLLPKMSDRQLGFDKRFPVHSLSNPVLYKETLSNNSESTIEEIVFLREIPIRTKDLLSGEGFEIYAPFIERIPISNPCLLDTISICDFSGELLIEASVFRNGVELTRQLPKWNENINSQCLLNQILFNHLVISSVVLNHICDECKGFKRYAAFSYNPFHEYYYGYTKKATHDQGIEKIIDYVNKLDIAAVIDSVRVSISHEHTYYRGEIDGGYYQTVIRSTLPKEYQNDRYLSALLRGKVLSSEDHYYKEGPIDDQQLQKTKFDLYKKYSKEEHVGCLVAEWQSYAFHNCLHKNLWDDYFAVLEYALCSFFHLDELSFKHNKFLTKYYNEVHYIYLIADREKNVATINDGISSSTKCSFDREEFKRLLSNLSANIVLAQHAINRHDTDYPFDCQPDIWNNDRLHFNYSLPPEEVWPPNKNNPMIR